MAGTISLGRWSLNALCIRPKSCIGSRNAPFTEILNALGGEDIVIPLPGELCLDVSLGGQTLKSLDDLEVRDIEFFVLRRIEVFFRN